MIGVPGVILPVLCGPAPAGFSLGLENTSISSPLSDHPSSSTAPSGSSPSDSFKVGSARASPTRTVTKEQLRARAAWEGACVSEPVCINTRTAWHAGYGGVEVQTDTALWFALVDVAELEGAVEQARRRIDQAASGIPASSSSSAAAAAAAEGEIPSSDPSVLDLRSRAMVRLVWR